MPGRHHIGPKPFRRLEKGCELDFPVAQDIRVGGSASGVFIEHIVHHPLSVLLAQVNEIERDADFPRDHFGHEPVLLPFAVTVQCALRVVPVLHEHGEHVMAGPLQEQGGDT